MTIQMSAERLAELKRLKYEGMVTWIDTELLAEIDRLRALVKSEEEAIEEFNAGFDAFGRGELHDNEPYGLKHDEWRVGWAWAAYPSLVEKNKKYRKALEFYAGREHMGPNSEGLVEDGEVAREALGGGSCSKTD